MVILRRIKGAMIIAMCGIESTENRSSRTLKNQTVTVRGIELKLKS